MGQFAPAWRSSACNVAWLLGSPLVLSSFRPVLPPRLYPIYNRGSVLPAAPRLRANRNFHWNIPRPVVLSLFDPLQWLRTDRTRCVWRSHGHSRGFSWRSYARPQFPYPICEDTYTLRSQPRWPRFFPGYCSFPPPFPLLPLITNDPLLRFVCSGVGLRFPGGPGLTRSAAVVAFGRVVLSLV